MNHKSDNISIWLPNEPVGLEEEEEEEEGEEEEEEDEEEEEEQEEEKIRKIIITCLYIVHFHSVGLFSALTY